MPEERRYASFHLAEQGGEIASAGAALARVVERLAPRAKPLARTLGALYPPVARARRVLGRLVPNGPAPTRYP